MKPITYGVPRLKAGKVAKVTFLAIVAVVGVPIAHGLGGIGGLSLVFLIGLVALAFANGANDLPKSIATLVGSGAASYRRALWAGVVATVIGGGLAVLWSGALLRLFSAGGITGVDSSTYPMFPIAVVCGAACWLLLATRFGLPVSTTHALIGASVGAALAAQGTEGVRWGTLVLAVAVPLLAAPLVAVPLGFAISRAASPHRGEGRESARRILHLLSAAGSSAARAFNDTPKIAGVGLLALAAQEPAASSDRSLWLIVLTVVAMAVGGLWASRRVNETLALRLVTLDSRSGLSANASNTVLVGAGSFLGLPLSTTHVSGAALVGAALGGRRVEIRWDLARDIMAGWIVTVPGGAALTTFLWWLLWAMPFLV